MTTTQLIQAPASITGGNQYQQLGYIEARDAMSNDDYAFVAYQQTDSSGAWLVHIDGRHSSGAFFEPDAICSKARTASAQGKTWFPWGYSIDPSESDPRSVEFRVHVKDGKPQEIEMAVQLRKTDGSADAPQSTRFAWPSAGKDNVSASRASLLPAVLTLFTVFWQFIRPS